MAHVGSESGKLDRHAVKHTEHAAIAPGQVAARMPRIDFVFPNGNEEHLAEMSERMDITHLVFCYGLDDPLLKSRAKEALLLAHPGSGFTTEFAIIINNQQDVSKARALTKTVVGMASPEIFEDKRVTHIIDMESARRDDFIHHRNSGLNQVFIEGAMRSGKTLLIDARQLLFSSAPKPVTLGRMMQNNAFYRKYRPDVIVVSGAQEPLEMRPWRDLQNLLDI